MTKEEFVKYLQDNDLRFDACEYGNGDKKVEFVYIFGREEYDLVLKHPRKYKNLYVPQIRVSHFDEKYWYVKDNGYCCHMSVEEVLKKCLKLK